MWWGTRGTVGSCHELSDRVSAPLRLSQIPSVSFLWSYIYAQGIQTHSSRTKQDPHFITEHMSAVWGGERGR